MGGKGGEPIKQGRPALPPDLAMEIKEFMRENPEMGESSLSGFVTNASKLYLQRLRYMKFVKLIINSSKGGKIPERILDEIRLPEDLD